jgi:hypothetical protein
MRLRYILRYTRPLDSLHKVDNAYAADDPRCLSGFTSRRPGRQLHRKGSSAISGVSGPWGLRILITELGGGEGKAEATMCRWKVGCDDVMQAWMAHLPYSHTIWRDEDGRAAWAGCRWRA